MKLYAGVDPDLHTTPFVLINEKGEPQVIRITSISAKFKAERAVIQQHEAIFRIMSDATPILMANGTYANVAAWAVESQEIAYTARKGANPRDMIPLAQVAGSWAAVISGMYSDTALNRRLMPKPQEWKGSVPKQIHHARVCKELGWECQKRGSLRNGGYCRPILAADSPWIKLEADHGITCWKHVLDAIGLALYAREIDLKLTAKGI